MPTVTRSVRLYFWPIITANMLAMTLAVGGDLRRASLFAIVISCLASFGFLLNDLWDRDVDRANKAGHFEHSATATVVGGIAAGCFFLFAGLGLAWWCGRDELEMAIVIACALVAYSLVLRKLLLIPAILAAVLAASPLWSPLLFSPGAADVWKWLFVGALIVMLAARETLMDVRDRVGDVVGNRHTLTTVFGARIAKLTAFVLTGGACLLLTAIALRNAVQLSTVGTIGSLTVTALIVCLVIVPTARAVQDIEHGREAIQRYVYSSRGAMLLVPLLTFILWSC